MFPPRRLWRRPRKERRRGLSSVDVTALTLVRTTIALRNNPEYASQPWCIKLQEFINTVRHRALGADECTLGTPRIVPQPKSGEWYRPIAVYPLADRVILSLVASYLRSTFDDQFLPCSYAFRGPRPDGTFPTHHDAVIDLDAFRAETTQAQLWVAECDIRGFFDCVSHAQARSAFQDAVNSAAANGVVVDVRARRVFEAYLKSYTFWGVAFPGAQESLSRIGKTGSLKWPTRPMLSLGIRPSIDAVGVPQGGALSCLIANLMLHKADLSVRDVAPSQELFYARYCDDMIIVAPDKPVCEEGFQSYLATLRALQLAVHQPIEVLAYNKAFWSVKSKLPYSWAPKSNGSASVPWLAFVGYQLRHDGTCRIRPSSINRELRKQVQEVDRVLNVVRTPSSASAAVGGYSDQVTKRKGQIESRVHQRLICMSVGRQGLTPNPDAGFCWAAGFRVLKGRNHVRDQLRTLDRGRERQIRRLRRALAALPDPNDKPSEPVGRPHYGAPFSYARQFSQWSDETDQQNDDD